MSMHIHSWQQSLMNDPEQSCGVDDQYHWDVTIQMLDVTPVDFPDVRCWTWKWLVGARVAQSRCKLGMGLDISQR